MKEGPDISRIAAMMGDPARANMLMALMSGMAFTSKELAAEAGVTASTASTHLAQLEALSLVTARKQGRFRYFALADDDVAHAVEALVTVAARAGQMRTRPGPKDDGMRAARSCYDHLAGALAVSLFEHWKAADVLALHGDEAQLTDKGRVFLEGLGIDVAGLGRRRRPLCRTCLDWSERKFHLGGGIGAAVLSQMLGKGWAKREEGARTLRITPHGAKDFRSWYEGRASE